MFLFIHEIRTITHAESFLALGRYVFSDNFLVLVED